MHDVNVAHILHQPMRLAAAQHVLELDKVVRQRLVGWVVRERLFLCVQFSILVGPERGFQVGPDPGVVGRVHPWNHQIYRIWTRKWFRARRWQLHTKDRRRRKHCGLGAAVSWRRCSDRERHTSRAPAVSVALTAPMLVAAALTSSTSSEFTRVIRPIGPTMCVLSYATPIMWLAQRRRGKKRSGVG